MEEHKYRCNKCNYRTNHAGMWRRHCESSKHNKNALVVVSQSKKGKNQSDSKINSDSQEHKLLLGKTLQQLKETLYKKENEIQELKCEIEDLKQKLSKAEKVRFRPRVENNTNNTFIFMVDDSTFNDNRIEDFVKQFESRISQHPASKDSKTDLVVFNVEDSLQNIKID